MQSHPPLHLLSFPTCLHLVNLTATAAVAAADAAADAAEFCIQFLIIAIASYIFMALQNQYK
jgi:hypothetical protein